MRDRHHHTQKLAAARAGFSERTARRVEADPRLPSQRKPARRRSRACQPSDKPSSIASIASLARHHRHRRDVRTVTGSWQILSRRKCQSSARVGGLTTTATTPDARRIGGTRTMAPTSLGPRQRVRMMLPEQPRHLNVGRGGVSIGFLMVPDRGPKFLRLHKSHTSGGSFLPRPARLCPSLPWQKRRAQQQSASGCASHRTSL